MDEYLKLEKTLDFASDEYKKTRWETYNIFAWESSGSFERKNNCKSYMIRDSTSNFMSKYILIPSKTNYCKIIVNRIHLTENVSIYDLQRMSDELVLKEEFNDIFKFHEVDKSKCLLLDIDKINKMNGSNVRLVANVMYPFIFDMTIDIDCGDAIKNIYKLNKYTYTKNKKENLIKQLMYVSGNIMLETLIKNNGEYIDDILEVIEIQ